MQSDCEGAAEQATKQHATKIEQWRVRFAKLREDVSNEKEKWMCKYSKLEEQLQSTRDRVYLCSFMSNVLPGPDKIFAPKVASPSL